jgi:hypothetical protein
MPQQSLSKGVRLSSERRLRRVGARSSSVEDDGQGGRLRGGIGGKGGEGRGVNAIGGVGLDTGCAIGGAFDSIRARVALPIGRSDRCANISSSAVLVFLRAVISVTVHCGNSRTSSVAFIGTLSYGRSIY